MMVKVDRDLCVGLGNCVALIPTVFGFDDEGKSVVLDSASVADDILLEAAMSCSYDAIIILDDEGNQVYPKPSIA
jgi:ferredoxin|tara:strand:+ start:541 stop:765 length:225 start_codon:yes stop_codon:yes gene_type:complete